MTLNKCCEAGSLISILISAFGSALNILPPIVAIISGSLAAYYYYMKIRDEKPD